MAKDSKAQTLVDSIEQSIKALAVMTDEAKKSETFKTWLQSISRFHHYSFNNQFLILLQRSSATRVAGFHTWKSMGRNVKKGAKGIAILAPCVSKVTTTDTKTGEEKTAMRLRGFRDVYVFDVADTEGKELPELTYRAKEGGEVVLPKLENAARKLEIAFEYKADTGAARGWSEGGKIVVRDTMTATEKCGTLAHEIAHEILHWQGNRRDQLTREQRELEAEATSYAVLYHLGIEQPSSMYLASWSADADSITASLNTISEAVHTILAATEETKDEAAKIAA